MKLVVAALLALLLFPRMGFAACQLEASGATKQGTTSQANSPISPALPTGTANNDIAIVELFLLSGTTTITPPSGYILIGSAAQTTDVTLAVYWHQWKTGDTVTPSFSFTGNQDFNWITAAYTGCSSSPIDGTPTTNVTSASGNTIQCASVTPSATDALVFTHASYQAPAAADTFTYTSPLAQEALLNFGNNDFTGLADAQISGASGAQTATAAMGTPFRSACVMFALAPAGAGPTATATSTATATATATGGATPTATATATSTATATATSTSGATPTPTPIFSQGTYVPLDKYGGDTLLKCPNGPSTIWYTQQIGNRWWFCDPLGNGVFLTSLYAVARGDAGYRYQTRTVPAAACTGAGAPVIGCTGSGTCVGCSGRYWNGYPINTNVISGEQTVPGVWFYNWTLHQIDVMKYLGFNSFSDDTDPYFFPTRTDSNWNTANHTMPVAYRLPFINKAGNSYYALHNSAGCGQASAIKDIGNGIPSLSASYTGLHGDWFDPHYVACADGIIASAFSGGAMDNPTTPNFDFFAGIVMDETGQNNFLLPGPDFRFIIGSTLSANRSSIHTGYEVLVTDPIQVGAVGAPDAEIYSKVKLADIVATKYAAPSCTGAGTPFAACTGLHTAANGSVDPSCTGTLPIYCMGDTYIGTSILTTAKNALNTAWSSAYTTLSTSDSHCTNNLAECLIGNAPCTGSNAPYSWCTGAGTGAATAYASWGTGTGLMDEKGSNTWTGDACTLGSNTSTGACGSPLGGAYSAETASMQTDIRNFYRSYLDVWYGTLSSGYRGTLGANFPLIVEVGSYGSPAHQEVYQELLTYNLIPSPSTAYCPSCTDFQAREDFVNTYYGNGPQIAQVFNQANADSQIAWAGISANLPQASTQAGRGQAFASWIGGLETLHDSATNTYHDIGYGMWSLPDEDAQGQDFGPVSADDHLYDGRCSTATFSFDQWYLPCGERVLDNTMCGAAGSYLTECTGVGTGTVPTTAAGNYACTANATPYACCTGVKTGTCTTNYGDYTDYIVTTNRSIYPNIAPLGLYAGGVM